MYLISLMVEDISGGLDSYVLSNVGVITDLKEITPKSLKGVTDSLCTLACESQFMRKGEREAWGDR